MSTKQSNQSNLQEMDVPSLAALVGQWTFAECEQAREVLRDRVNRATAELSDDHGLAGVEFGPETPTVVLLRALGALAALDSDPGAEDAGMTTDDEDLVFAR